MLGLECTLLPVWTVSIRFQHVNIISPSIWTLMWSPGFLPLVHVYVFGLMWPDAQILSFLWSPAELVLLSLLITAVVLCIMLDAPVSTPFVPTGTCGKRRMIKGRCRRCFSFIYTTEIILFLVLALFLSNDITVNLATALTPSSDSNLLIQYMRVMWRDSENWVSCRCILVWCKSNRTNVFVQKQLMNNVELTWLHFTVTPVELNLCHFSFFFFCASSFEPKVSRKITRQFVSTDIGFLPSRLDLIRGKKGNQ